MHSPRLLLAWSLGVKWAGSDVTQTGRRAPGPTVVILLIVGVTLDLLISAALGYAVHQARQAASEAHILKVAAYETCLANNDTKAADLTRWNHVLTLVESGPPSLRLSVFVDGVRKANQTADAPRDCHKVVP